MSSICEHCRLLGARNVCNNLKYHRNIHLRQIQIITDQEIHWDNFHVEHDHTYFTLNRSKAIEECSTTMRVSGQEIVKPEFENAMDTPVNVKLENSEDAMGMSEEYALEEKMKIAEESENAIEIEKYEKSEPEEEIINDVTPMGSGNEITQDWTNEQPNRSQTLYEMCEQTFMMQNVQETVFCGECQKRIVIDQRNGENRFQNIIDHVCVHLACPVFVCRFCSLKVNSRSAIRIHLTVVHSRPSLEHKYLDRIDIYQKEIMEMIDRCFGQNSTNRISQPIEKKTDIVKFDDNKIKMCSLYNACEQMFINNPSHKRLRCRECTQRVSLHDQRYGTNRFQYIIHHVCIHLNVSVFFCRYCDSKFKSLLSIRDHLKEKHDRSWNKCHYVDMTSKYQKMITKMVKWCFWPRANQAGQQDGHQVNPARQQDVLGKKESGKPIRIHQFHTPALVELCQQICAVYLTDKAVDCRECLKQVPIITYRHGVYRFLSVIDHVLAHLPIPMFTCLHCYLKFQSRSQVHDHLRVKHNRLVVKDQYMDKTSVYQLDIMEMMEWCFCQNPYHSIRPKSLEPISNRGRPKKSLSESPLFNTCTEILSSHHSSKWIICRECESKIDPFGSDVPEQGLEILVTHARIHLGISVFLCRHCNSRFVTRINIKLHLAEKHRIFTHNDYVDITNDYLDDITKAILWCFGHKIRANRSDRLFNEDWSNVGHDNKKKHHSAFSSRLFRYWPYTKCSTPP